MSDFTCPVVRVRITPHQNADALEIAHVLGYKTIVRKGQFQDGDLAVYLPEDALLPPWLLQRLEFWNKDQDCGTLNGAGKNRVKAIRLRGVVSQGVLMKVRPDLSRTGIRLYITSDPQTMISQDAFEGDDVATLLGVTKYEPIIPAHMAGRALGANANLTHSYDFENIKKVPDLFEYGERVVITEKIHGTFMQIVVVPDALANDKFYKGRVALTSKGLGKRGILLDHNDMGHVYAQVAHQDGLLDKMAALTALATDAPLVLFGEVFGEGIQDLTYGGAFDGARLRFRAFDLCRGVRALAQFASDEEFTAFCQQHAIDTVPVLYRGPYSKQIMLSLTDGVETVSGHGAHLREGVVVKTALTDEDGYELRHPYHGRKIAKSISDAYLLRANGTELT